MLLFLIYSAYLNKTQKTSEVYSCAPITKIVAKQTEMVLNTFGKIACDEWFKTESLRPNIKMHEFIVMPNHIHGIINILHPVGASCCSPELQVELKRASAARPYGDQAKL